MNLIPRSALIATPMALALTLAVTVGSSAQVASLVSPDETPAPSAETESVVEFEDREEALLAYAQCMRDNGIDMDDPQAGTGGGRGFLRLGGGPGGQRAVDQFGEDFQIAQQACADILEAARPEVDPEAAQEQLESQLLLAQCIRDQGYPQYPDPMIGTDGRLERVGPGTFEELGIDRRSEEFGEVVATCREEVGLEQFGPGGGPGPGRGGN
jgi:hypothetical protein